MNSEEFYVLLNFSIMTPMCNLIISVAVNIQGPFVVASFKKYISFCYNFFKRIFYIKNIK
jgi:hypothetical protein